MSLADELEQAAAAAARLAAPGEEVAAVLAAEPAPGIRTYLCAFHGAAGDRTWLVLDAAGAPVTMRRDVRDAVLIAAHCEIAEESAGGGALDELHARLTALRIGESPPGSEEAEEAVLSLQRTVGVPPQLATPVRLEAIGVAARRLELALDPTAASSFAAAMQAAQDAIQALAREVEAGYRLELT